MLLSNRINTKRKKKGPLPKIGRVRVRSEFEYTLYKQIKNALPKGYTVEYEPDKLEYVVTHTYLPDFKITSPSGQSFYVEAKGNGLSFDSHTRRKMVEVKKQHPDVDIAIVFFRDGKIGRVRADGSFRRQSDWAQENDYKFSIGEFSLDWIKDLE